MFTTSTKIGLGFLGCVVVVGLVLWLSGVFNSFSNKPANQQSTTTSQPTTSQPTTSQTTTSPSTTSPSTTPPKKDCNVLFPGKNAFIGSNGKCVRCPTGTNYNIISQGCTVPCNSEEGWNYDLFTNKCVSSCKSGYLKDLTKDVCFKCPDTYMRNLNGLLDTTGTIDAPEEQANMCGLFGTPVPASVYKVTSKALTIKPEEVLE